MPEDILEIVQRTEASVKEAFRLLSPDFTTPDAGKIEKVVVILGSSRSGSSFLFHLLSESGAFWSAQGEESAFHRLAGIGFAGSESESDALSAEPTEQQLCIVRDRLLSDVGRGPGQVSDHYIAQSIARILLQWPERQWNLSEMIFVARTCLDGRDLSWGRYLNTLGIDPSHYDGFGGVAPKLGADILFEEPPFVTQVPRGTPKQKLDAPLLLKTSSNVYRPELLRALFPKAEFKYILLTRNPAACINGLMDGWQSPAFHSHHVGNFRKLNIEGYSELNSDNSGWWKFDMPPGWATVADKPLGEVCAMQWSSAYHHALSLAGDKMSFRFEDLLSGQAAALAKIFAFAGVSPTQIPDPATARPIMSSQPPGPARWRSRQNEIEPLIRDSSIREVARELGYDLDSPRDLV